MVPVVDGEGGGVGGFRATLRPTIGPGQSLGRGPGARPLEQCRSCWIAEIFSGILFHDIRKYHENIKTPQILIWCKTSYYPQQQSVEYLERNSMGWNVGIPLVSLVSKAPDSMFRYSEVLNNQKIASSFQLYYHSLVFCFVFVFTENLFIFAAVVAFERIVWFG